MTSMTSWRGLSLFNKIVFLVNGFVALPLFLASFTPYVPIHKFPALSFLGLAVPVLVVANLIFVIYWLLSHRRFALLSVIVLVIGFFALGNFIRPPFAGNENLDEQDLRIMTFNVRGFNGYKDMDDKAINLATEAFVIGENADIVCLQEVGNIDKDEYTTYPYRYVQNSRDYERVRLGILSKYPIIDAQILNFPDTYNSGSYADILYKNDTLRIYSLHLQSLGITPGKGVIKSSSSEKLYKQLTGFFKKQEDQAKYVVEHASWVNYKTIICGDFNNSQFSRTYKILHQNRSDSFKEQGQGYGRTFIFHGVPVRIDFILADPQLEVTGHKNYDIEYSDHFPIMASFRLNGE
ncbi:endonuclease/exonuclease/phosphatase family protein [Maribacter halichondriae]|uniref:endonuclease/exonuclease/phosphatase family protein n=1 Tax=Maribacter halichondriae TaxID=2980554 RepID=UPI002359014F|nr:endonuclease/exonuclease/phosphatase family protein [Maribacter sp. Hal144]